MVIENLRKLVQFTANVRMEMCILDLPQRRKNKIKQIVHSEY